MSEQREHWSQTPEGRARRAANMRERMANPEVRARMMRNFKRPSIRYPWTAPQDTQLVALRTDGVSWRRISWTMNVDWRTAKRRYEWLLEKHNAR